MTTTMQSEHDHGNLSQRAQRLGLYGLLAHFDELKQEEWIPMLLDYEEAERDRRSLERRLKNAKLGKFKPMADFDWQWPKKIDHEHVQELFTFDSVSEAANVILIGPNGVGKTMIAANLAYQAIHKGYTVRFLTASELLNDLAAQESSSAFMRRFRHYTQPLILVIDEIGYLATSSEHADLLFEIVTRRYQEISIILTTNKRFAEWNQVFPNSACVVTLVDLLIHKSEIVVIDGKSYRHKESLERADKNKQKRSRKKKSK